MPDEVLFESAFHLAEQIKGAALTRYEKQDIIDGFHKASGSAFDRLIAAIAHVLHTTPGAIFKKGEALDDVRRLTTETRVEAQEWEADVSASLQKAAKMQKRRLQTTSDES
jgi:hypothetical protein